MANVATNSAAATEETAAPIVMMVNLQDGTSYQMLEPLKGDVFETRVARIIQYPDGSVEIFSAGGKPNAPAAFRLRVPEHAIKSVMSAVPFSILDDVIDDAIRESESAEIREKYLAEFVEAARSAVKGDLKPLTETLQEYDEEFEGEADEDEPQAITTQPATNGAPS